MTDIDLYDRVIAFVADEIWARIEQGRIERERREFEAKYQNWAPVMLP